MNVLECVKDIFQNVNNWTSFAEAKNAALLGFDIAVLAISDKLLNNIGICENIGLCIFLIGTLFPLVSFFPRYHVGKPKRSQANLLFFRDIATYDSSEYFQELKTRYQFSTCEQTDQLLADYAEEIVTNSRITVYKLSMFRIGLVFSIGFIVFLVLSNLV